LRKGIAWTEEHPFNALQKRVRDAVQSMRAPAWIEDIFAAAVLAFAAWFIFYKVFCA